VSLLSRKTAPHGASISKKLLLTGAVFLFATANVNRAHAQGFIDTTSGNIDEKANGIKGDNYDRKSQDIINQFKRGRISSAKDVSSRFSGHLEFHDSNQDGVVDHDVGDGNQGLEGKVKSLLPSGRDLLEQARNSSKKANVEKCGDEKGTAAETKDSAGKTIPSGYRACFNPSGIIVDDGATHGGDKSRHRKYKLSAGAMAAAKESGEAMGIKTIEDAQKAIRAIKGGDSGTKVAALDLLRAEAVWAEDQKESQYERSWQTLRAARLIGADNVAETQAGTEGAAIMHEVDEIISNAASKEEADEKVAEAIAAASTVKSQRMIVDQHGNWTPLDPSKENQLNSASNPFKTLPDDQLRRYVEDTRPGIEEKDVVLAIESLKGQEKVTLSVDELQKLGIEDKQMRQARDQAKSFILSNESTKESVDKAKKALLDNECLKADVWCHNKNTSTGSLPSESAPSNGTAATSTEQKPNLYDRFEGSDPGDIFQDTRELANINAQKAIKAPVADMRRIISNADFNESTNPEVFEELTALEDQTETLHKNAKANGADVYDPKTHNLREISGIRQGVNDSWSDEVDVRSRDAGTGLRKPSGAAQTAPGSGNYGGSATPVGYPVSNGSTN